jgi:hypothetical protein
MNTCKINHGLGNHIHACLSNSLNVFPYEQLFCQIILSELLLFSKLRILA